MKGLLESLQKPTKQIENFILHYRDVAQLGSVPRLGRGGRRFKSCHPDFSAKIGFQVAPTVSSFTIRCSLHSYGLYNSAYLFVRLILRLFKLASARGEGTIIFTLHFFSLSTFQPFNPSTFQLYFTPHLQADLTQRLTGLIFVI